MSKKKQDGQEESAEHSSSHAAPPREYNPRGVGYLLICVFSLALFSSISSVDNDTRKVVTAKNFSISWGVLSFIASGLILIFDRIAFLNKYFDLKNLGGEKKRVEGYVILVFVVWWTFGVGLMTHAGGIAYEAMNIYFMAWGCLYWSIFTLDQWSADKDIISLKELTRLSLTLPAWYMLFFSSLVGMSSAADLFVVMTRNGAFNLSEKNYDSLVFAIFTGAMSTLISLLAIMVHYKIITFCGIQQGGPVELGVSFFLAFWWIIATGVLTDLSGVAATIVGKGCNASGDIPGSNLYVSTWASLISSCMLVFRWNASRALRFAQTEERIFSDVAGGADLGQGSIRSEGEDER